MRNDPHAPDPCAVHRVSGHEHPLSVPKMKGLFPPLGPTGVPLGGLGTGGITRASDGRFSRWTIKGGGVAQFEIPANGFLLRVNSGTPQTRALQPAPQPQPAFAGKDLGTFVYEEAAPAWSGLFPFAWHDHSAIGGVTAQCLSFSPVCPGDLASAALPVALFRWRLTNTGTTPADVTLAFSFANMNGCFADFTETRPPRPAAGLENHPMQGSGLCGVVLDRRRTGPEPLEGSGQWGIAVQPPTHGKTSRTLCYDALSDGAALWGPLHETGDLPDLGPGFVTEGGFRDVSPGLPAAAVASRQTIAPGESCEVTFALTWDLPVITFGQGRRWYRAYTDDWGRQGTGAAALAAYALAQADLWQARIAAWHDATKAELGPDPHRAAMAINESYFLVDGLTVYTSAHGAPDGLPHFALIECHDYALYNTLDLWIYAAEAVRRFDPRLSAMVSRDFAAQLLAEDTTPRLHQWTRKPFALNPKGCCPHDLGGPSEDPFVTPNSYTYRDSTLWKDLNCDLVLCLFRDGLLMGPDWRKAQYPAVIVALDHLQQFDRDGDGLIENDGTPDQTFDNIPMRGPSSYCGGLWIAALLAGARLAEGEGDRPRAKAWADQARMAAESYDHRLFTGESYRVDTDGPFSNASFIEQLLGPFLARRYGLGDIIPTAHARKALQSLYKINFEQEGRGMGAVSLARIPEASRRHLPHTDDTSFQTSEIQPGFNFSLAAQLEEWGLDTEADTLRRALHHELHHRRNLGFQTPAAFDTGGLTARAVLNMRPLSIWWMKRALP